MLRAVKYAAGIAACLSVISIITCFIFVPRLISEIQDIRSELDADMFEFRVCPMSRYAGENETP